MKSRNFLLTVAAASAMACAYATGTLGQVQGESQKPQSSLSSRLSEVKHFGYSFDKEVGGYWIFVYTADQMRDNLETLRTYRAEMKEYEAKLEELRQQGQDARDRGASTDETNAITTASNRLPRPRLRFSGSLSNMIRVGDDYIECESANDPARRSLIPISRIVSVLLPKPDQVEAE